jgi:2'-hydroxyisoflavone reductase
MSTIDRRTVLASSAALAGSAILPGWMSDAEAQAGESSVAKPAAPAKKLSILILGGTGFTGPHQVRYALSRGHTVTLFNRGRRPKEWPAAVEELTGDRDTNDYASLKGRKWDVCIDNPTSVPHWIRDAAAVLKGNVNHFIFISTLSVYASDAKPGQDESAPRHTYSGKDAMAETTANLRKDMSLYGPLKALSEDEANKHFPGMTTVIRPGLIVGPGDETDRFSYWPVRLSQNEKAGVKTLVPPLADPVSFIDARDLAEWTLRMAEQRTLGAFNAMGPAAELNMGNMLAGIQHGIKSNARLVEAGAAFLRENKVSAWGDLPVWVPGQGETAGFHRRSNARAMAAGLTIRPLPTTAADTLAWWNAQDEKRRVLRAGLKPEREAELLAKLKG